MALVADHAVDPRRAERSGLAVRTSANGRSTDVDVLTGDQVFTVSLPAVADQAGADRFVAIFRSVVSIRVEVDGPRSTASVRGIRHRLPVTQPVGLPVALGLLARGIPSVVSVSER